MSLSGLGDTGEAQPPPALFPAPESDTPTPGRRRGGAPQNRSSQDGPVQNGLPRTDDAGRQLVFFGADAAEPTVADLAGLLAGPGEVVRMGGTARLSVQVDAAWRVHVLVAELASRGLAASWEPTEGARHAVRTSYTRVLKPLAAAWLHGTTKRPPAAFHLTGRRLRLWLAAAGTPEPPDCFLLRLGADDKECWEPIGVALASAGLAGTLLGPAEGGPAYRIAGRRRLARLAELVGGAPSAAPAGAWPTRP
ncbi:hypothetical protein LUPAC06_02263 [Micromonospora saelicesensis]|uniref:hypothetical protein n=1 Tax=Micromonospora saelicesensis TaxID=285676 RepID=UPI000DC0220A|nr:hypothetical protein [Micromonospora saelicesensis]RAO58673.1 hypothetical protein LUPAC06_02263 [Micromonospora saelicesensis]